MKGFVNYLLLLRRPQPLRMAELNTYDDHTLDGYDFNEAIQDLELLVRYSLSCRVAKLYIITHDIDKQ